VDAGDLIYPIFVSATAAAPEPIESMPGQFRWPVTHVGELSAEIESLGIGAVLIFGVPKAKDERASEAFGDRGIVQEAVRAAKASAPDLTVITDVCVCAYMSHGHCGVMNGSSVDNEKTLPLLARIAVSHVKAGADIVAPSSMMDRQVGAIRHALDSQGFEGTPVLGYSAKFASGFYGPFREAADSAPSFGDRSSYQHDPANARHAVREIQADVEEGADLLMVKPGLAYLDIVARARALTDLPVAAYCVSGEYSMIKAAAERGWIDEKRIVMETLTAFRRAGADLVITYHAKEASQWLKDC